MKNLLLILGLFGCVEGASGVQQVHSRSVRCTTPQPPMPKKGRLARACMCCTARLKRCTSVFAKIRHLCFPKRSALRMQGADWQGCDAGVLGLTAAQIQQEWLVQDLFDAIRASDCLRVEELAKEIDISQAPVIQIMAVVAVADDTLCGHTLKLVEDGAFVRMIRILTHWGFDLSKESDAWFIVHEAVGAGLIHIVKALCDAGVNINLYNFFGQTALDSINEVSDDYQKAMLALNAKLVQPYPASYITALCAARRKRAHAAVLAMRALGAKYSFELR